jgi:flavin-dependent dehydrogenase
MRATGVANGATLEPYSWPIPSLAAVDLEASEVSGPDWLLVGDAAGLVDPITREGIFFALRSGQVAAEAILSDETRLYRDRIRGEIGAELARAARVKDRFFQPRMTRLLVPALARSAAIRAVMADLISGTQPYHGLKWRLARTLEVSLAWQLLSRAT